MREKATAEASKGIGGRGGGGKGTAECRRYGKGGRGWEQGARAVERKRNRER